MELTVELIEKESKCCKPTYQICLYARMLKTATVIYATFLMIHNMLLSKTQKEERHLMKPIFIILHN